MTTSTSSSAMTVAAAAVGCAFLLYGASRYSKSSKDPKKTHDVEDIDEDDCISPDDVVAIFDKLFLQMQQVVMQLSQQVQQIQMAGQMIPEKQLRQLLKSEFQRALLVCQGQVFEDNDVDADCLEKATWEFLDDPEEYPKVKRAVERFQKLYESISGENVVGWRPGSKNDEKSGGDKALAAKELSPEELMKAATIYFETITEKMIEMSKAYVKDGKDLRDRKISQEFQMEASTDANEAAEEALKSIGFTISDFRSSIDKHGRNPMVGQTLGMLQLKQQQELMAAGVPMM